MLGVQHSSHPGNEKRRAYAEIGDARRLPKGVQTIHQKGTVKHKVDR